MKTTVDLEQTLLDICADMTACEDKGVVANYIPELAKVSPDRFGMSVCLADGQQFSAGDAATRFSVQSVSKVFTLAIALGRYGDGLWRRVGREPSTHDFNSVQELEVRRGIPPNPFVNAGAIVTTDMVLADSTPAETLGEILRFIRQAASDEDILIDPAVAASEKLSGHKNWALAHFLKSFQNLKHPCERTLGVYFHHCAIEMTCEQLARFGRFLAGFSKSPNLVSRENIRSINALMMTCGHYNGSGEFAYRVGIPAKSGVGGGILAILPGKASIAVWAPGLNKQGNSLLGTKALEALSRSLDWSVFDSGGQ
ncbi:glutaminase [Allohahella sp. A8]|uniref:glutaminase n=1 Tax=Allohahella sp. A8 TaxID=3141461 RepID=UPI000C0A7583|nr:glutaminase [Hahellaceae bacterium]|tara:strand:+ start:28615 stop:29550 length:936 start_codon:yes stop_codon:yes gene_type:complete